LQFIEFISPATLLKQFGNTEIPKLGLAKKKSVRDFNWLMGRRKTQRKKGVKKKDRQTDRQRQLPL
jgi:hypothetical protein